MNVFVAILWMLCTAVCGVAAFVFSYAATLPVTPATFQLGFTVSAVACTLGAWSSAWVAVSELLD